MKRVLISALLSATLTSAASATPLSDAQQAVAKGECSTAVDTLNSLVEQQDSAAMNQLAGMYLVGKCVSKDQAAAKALYEQAAKAGSLRAQKMLERL